MKKTYIKPELVVEMFSLSQTIASGCNTTWGVKTYGDIGNCGWTDGDYKGGELVTYWNATPTCNTIVEGDVNGACYNAPSGSNIFAS